MTHVLLGTLQLHGNTIVGVSGVEYTHAVIQQLLPDKVSFYEFILDVSAMFHSLQTCQSWINVNDNAPKRHDGHTMVAIGNETFLFGGKKTGSVNDETLRYDTVLNVWSDDVIIPRALFSLGRLEEQKKNMTEAELIYDRLIEEYGSSSWSLIARNRIIALEVDKLLSED